MDETVRLDSTFRTNKSRLSNKALRPDSVRKWLCIPWPDFWALKAFLLFFFYEFTW